MQPIRLDLTHHCIETEIKRIYNQSVSRCFKSKNPDRQLEEKIELLKRLLEHMDFKRLRTAYPALAGHNPCDVSLSLNAIGEIIITLNGKQVHIEKIS